MDLAQTVGIVTAAAAVAAVGVALWTALHSMDKQRRLADRSAEQQRRLTERSMDQQRHLAHQQFLWDARAALYSRVLVFLHSRSAEVEALGTRIEEHQRQADLSDDRRMFAELAQEIEDLRSARGLPPRRRPNADAHEPVTHMDRAEIVTSFMELLQLTPDLRVDMDLLASAKAVEALKAYAGSVAFPHLVHDDVDAWIKALDVSVAALDALTAKLADELKLDVPSSLA